MIPVGVLQYGAPSYGAHRYWRIRVENDSAGGQTEISRIRLIGASIQRWSGLGADAGSWECKKVSDGTTPGFQNRSGAPKTLADVQSDWTEAVEIRSVNIAVENIYPTTRVESTDFYLIYDSGSGEVTNCTAIAWSFHQIGNGSPATDFANKMPTRYTVEWSDDNSTWQPAWSGDFFEGWTNSAEAFDDLMSSSNDYSISGLDICLPGFVTASPRYLSPLQKNETAYQFYAHRMMSHNGGSVYYNLTSFGWELCETAFVDPTDDNVPDTTNFNVFSWFSRTLDAFGAPVRATGCASNQYADNTTTWQMYRESQFLVDLAAKGGTPTQLAGFTMRGRQSDPARSFDAHWVAASPDGWQWGLVFRDMSLGGSTFWNTASFYAPRFSYDQSVQFQNGAHFIGSVGT